MHGDNLITVAALDLFPFKSLNAVSVQEVNVLASGALEGDRRWAIFDTDGKYVNGKRTRLIHAIRSRWNQSLSEIEIAIGETSWQKFLLPDQLVELEKLLSNHFEFPVQVEENITQGFPDDLEATGPTIIGTATLEMIAQWFPELSAEEVRRRFRANIILQTDVPFWEDRLFGNSDSPRLFRIGKVKFLGVNPCQRCVVPSRDSVTGKQLAGFQKKFAKQREQSLPDFVSREQFNHYYRLAVNTRLSPENSGASICCGDAVQVWEG